MDEEKAKQIRETDVIIALLQKDIQYIKEDLHDIKVQLKAVVDLNVQTNTTLQSHDQRISSAYQTAASAQLTANEAKKLAEENKIVNDNLVSDHENRTNSLRRIMWITIGFGIPSLLTGAWLILRELIKKGIV